LFDSIETFRAGRVALLRKFSDPNGGWLTAGGVAVKMLALSETMKGDGAFARQIKRRFRV
jgi:hypothetical protein